MQLDSQGMNRRGLGNKLIMSENQVEPDAKTVPRRDGLADERDDPQTQPATERDPCGGER